MTEAILERLIEQGWRDADSDPPNDDRVVQIAYDDGSHGDGHNGFYDYVSGHEEKGRTWWSTFGGVHLFPNIIAWRELKGQP